MQAGRRPGSTPRAAEGGAGGREKGRPVPASHLPGRLAREGLSPLSLLFQEKGAEEEEEKLAEGLGKVAAGPRCDIAERSRAAAGGGQRSGAQYVTPRGQRGPSQSV